MDHDELATALSYAYGGFGASSSSKAPTSSAKPKSAVVEDDGMDFGFDDDADAGELNEDGENAAEAAATKARRERMAAAAKLKEEKDLKDGVKKKEKMVEKSLIVLDVKPWEADTDLEAVWKMIIVYQQEGLRWGDTFKLEPVSRNFCTAFVAFPC